MPRQKLTARQDGRFSCKYNGKYFYGKTRAAAEKKRNEYVQRSESYLFRDIAADWWDHHEPTLALYDAYCEEAERRGFWVK